VLVLVLGVGDGSRDSEVSEKEPPTLDSYLTSAECCRTVQSFKCKTLNETLWSK